jgi:hypothetical protein
MNEVVIFMNEIVKGEEHAGWLAGWKATSKLSRLRTLHAVSFGMSRDRLAPSKLSARCFDFMCPSPSSPVQFFTDRPPVQTRFSEAQSHGYFVDSSS